MNATRKPRTRREPWWCWGTAEIRLPDGTTYFVNLNAHYTMPSDGGSIRIYSVWVHVEHRTSRYGKLLRKISVDLDGGDGLTLAKAALRSQRACGPLVDWLLENGF